MKAYLMTDYSCTPADSLIAPTGPIKGQSPRGSTHEGERILNEIACAMDQGRMRAPLRILSINHSQDSHREQITPTMNKLRRAAIKAGDCVHQSAGDHTKLWSTKWPHKVMV